MALTKWGLAREQPFTLWITTGGPEGGLLGDLLEQIESGPGQRESRRGGGLQIYRDRANGILIYWYGAPAGADAADPAVWRACNPATRADHRIRGVTGKTPFVSQAPTAAEATVPAHRRF